MPVVVGEGVVTRVGQGERPGQESGCLGPGQVPVGAEPVVRRRVASHRDPGLCETVNRSFQDMTVVIDEMIGVARREGQGTGDHRCHLGPGEDPIGAEPVVERRVAPDRYLLGGNGLDPSLVDDPVVVGEGAPGGRRRSRKQCDEKCEGCDGSHRPGPR